MNLRIAVQCAVFATLFVGMAESAAASKYKCKTVDSIARLGVPDWQPVTIEDGGRDSETDGRFCAFAVAGVAASSPPLARVQEALGWLGSADGPPGSDTLAEHVAWALIAASPHDEPPDQLRSLMSEHAESLEACFENYWSDSTAEIRYMENETAKAYCVYNTEGSFEDWQVEAHFDMPRLVVFYYDEGETWSGQPRPVSRWLFLPRDPRKHEQ